MDTLIHGQSKIFYNTSYNIDIMLSTNSPIILLYIIIWIRGKNIYIRKIKLYYKCCRVFLIFIIQSIIFRMAPQWKLQYYDEMYVNEVFYVTVDLVDFLFVAEQYL